jgi:hypothetical protein
VLFNFQVIAACVFMVSTFYAQGQISIDELKSFSSQLRQSFPKSPVLIERYLLFNDELPSVETNKMPNGTTAVFRPTRNDYYLAFISSNELLIAEFQKPSEDFVEAFRKREYTRVAGAVSNKVWVVDSTNRVLLYENNDAFKASVEFNKLTPNTPPPIRIFSGFRSIVTAALNYGFQSLDLSVSDWSSGQDVVEGLMGSGKRVQVKFTVLNKALQARLFHQEDGLYVFKEESLIENDAKSNGISRIWITHSLARGELRTHKTKFAVAEMPAWNDNIDHQFFLPETHVDMKMAAVIRYSTNGSTVDFTSSKGQRISTSLRKSGEIITGAVEKPVVPIVISALLVISIFPLILFWWKVKTQKQKTK